MPPETHTKQHFYARDVSSVDSVASTVVKSAEDMWEDKRENQRRDIEGLKAGTLSSDDVNWFAGGIARRAKLVGSLF